MFVAKYADDDDDDDGVPGDQDQCPAPELSPTVVLAGCDTGVANELLTNPAGCTITDLILGEAAGARNHGQFVSGAARLLTGLQRQGVLTGSERGAIQRCVAQADLP